MKKELRQTVEILYIFKKTSHRVVQSFVADQRRNFKHEAGRICHVLAVAINARLQPYSLCDATIWLCAVASLIDCMHFVTMHENFARAQVHYFCIKCF